jgi:NitT/TauT family transport system substrate-binding protein
LGTTYELFALRALEEGGLTSNDVAFVDVNVEDVPANLGNTIDAGYTWDPFASDALAAGATLLLKSGGSSTITPDVLVFRADVVEKRPEDIRSFLKAWFEAIDYRYSNPEDANRIIAEALGVTPGELSEDAHIFTSQENAILFSSQAPADTINLIDAFTTNTEYLIRNGSLSKLPDLNQLLDPSFLP